MFNTILGASHATLPIKRSKELNSIITIYVHDTQHQIMFYLPCGWRHVESAFCASVPAFSSWKLLNRKRIQDFFFLFEELI